MKSSCSYRLFIVSLELLYYFLGLILFPLMCSLSSAIFLFLSVSKPGWEQATFDSVVCDTAPPLPSSPGESTESFLDGVQSRNGDDSSSLSDDDVRGGFLLLHLLHRREISAGRQRHRLLALSTPQGTQGDPGEKRDGSFSSELEKLRSLRSLHKSW